MHTWRIRYHTGDWSRSSEEMRAREQTYEVRAPTACDAISMFEIEMRNAAVCINARAFKGAERVECIDANEKPELLLRIEQVEQRTQVLLEAIKGLSELVDMLNRAPSSIKR